MQKCSHCNFLSYKTPNSGLFGALLFWLNIFMPASVIITNTETSTQGPKLKRGSVRVYTSTAVHWVVGEDPIAQKQSCALLPANTSIELRIPVNCSRLAVIAAYEPGYVTITDVPGAKASCV